MSTTESSAQYLILAAPPVSRSWNDVSESYFALAIDVGNSRVSAAVSHVGRDAYDNPVLFSLGASEHSASSAVYIDEDGALYFGDTAERLGTTNPHRLAREFAHDVGDDVPVVVGEHAVAADDLVARLCAWIVDEVTAAEGAPPTLVAITHPASWGGHRLARLRAALERAGVDDALLVSESEAAAANLEASHPLEPGQLLAVYDLGGTRFDARVLRRRSGGRYQPVGEQVRIDHLGGSDFDDALLRHVMTDVAQDDDDAARAAYIGVRREVVGAKELLSSAGDATVQLALPSGSASVRVTRSEFEAMIDADLDRTVEALDLAIESADTQSDRIAAIALTGGSSRIPLVAQRLSERFDLPIHADADPKATTALGAARIANEQLQSSQTAPGTALAVLGNVGNVGAIEKAPVPRPEKAPERAGALAFLRPLLGKPGRSTSPLLLAGAAVFIAVTIVFSSTTAAGTRWPDYVQEAAVGLLNLPKPDSVASAPLPTPKPAPPGAAVPVSDKAASPVIRTDNGSERQTEEKSTPARKSSRPPASAPSTPTTPRNPGSGPQVEPTPPPETTTPTDTTPTPASDPEPTTPPETPAPVDPTPDPTPVDPAPPDPTPEPTPDPAPVDPAPVDPPPDPTPVDLPPEPVETTSPADPPPVEPAPEQTPGPASEPV